MRSGLLEFLREFSSMLLDEYDRWLTGTVLLVLAIGVVDAVGPHWAATSVVWLAFVPAVALSVHAAVHARRRVAAAGQTVDSHRASAVADVPMPEPLLAFQAPRIESAHPAESERSSGIVLCAAIANARTGTQRVGKALEASPSISWTTPEGRHGPIEGRWRGAHSSAAIDLLPNGLPYLVEITLKLPGEKRFRVVGRERSYWVPEERASVTVVIHGANFAPISVTYSIWSEDGGEPALHFREEVTRPSTRSSPP